MKIFPLKIHEILFLLAGAGMLTGVLWFSSIGTTMWPASKAAYLIGVMLFTINTLKNVRN